MKFESLIYKENEETAWILLNRPEVMNALSMKLSEEIVAAIEIVRQSTKLKFLVIKGEGPNFCVGDDIKEMIKWGNANDITRRCRYYQNMANQLEELDKITIAAVDGYAVGGGLEITMVCDFVIATERSKWGMPEVDVGITPGWGGTTRLARLIGRRRAKEINLIGALHTSKKAVEWNLWNRVVANDQLDEEVKRLLEVLKTKNQQGMRQLKFIINRGVECDLYTAQGFEVLSGALTGAVSGMWKIKDADQGKGIIGFTDKASLWQTRRRLAKDFWVD
ncbi:MAG TPA: enoyl-CoA hydratase/isomerase family protein [Candidatus Nanopelagicaceae bacterium]|nr:enoyl-CoA hydratase/isomerase family protein [Candidatus Nanopelagicaceae bacterium]